MKLGDGVFYLELLMRDCDWKFEGEKDNVMSEIPRQVLEVTFPGSGDNVEKLIKNQRESIFVDAQPQQQEKESKGRKGPFVYWITMK